MNIKIINCFPLKKQKKKIYFRQSTKTKKKKEISGKNLMKKSVICRLLILKLMKFRKFQKN